jgi:hypothetical protein
VVAEDVRDGSVPGACLRLAVTVIVGDFQQVSDGTLLNTKLRLCP